MVRLFLTTTISIWTGFFLTAPSQVHSCPYLRGLLESSATFTRDDEGYAHLGGFVASKRERPVYSFPPLELQIDSPSDARLSHNISESLAAGKNPETRWLQTVNSGPNSIRATAASSEAVNTAIQKAKADLVALIKRDRALIPQFVRLIFHDCTGGSCDGCVLLTDPHNFGLQSAMAALEGKIVPTYRTWLTRGDIYVLAALTAAELSQVQDGTEIPFAMQGYGRVPCQESFTRGPKSNMVGAQLILEQLLVFFKRQFGFNTRQVVAIMGAHTLGGAFKRNSGFDGDHWTITPLLLNNDFYRAMTDFKTGQSIRSVRSDYVLTSQKNPPNSSFPEEQFFWTRSVSSCDCVDFLLNVDMALAVNLTAFLHGKNGKVDCALRGGSNPKNLPICPEQWETLSIITEYARNETRWKLDFRQALLQMSNAGYRTATNCGQPICPLVPI